MRLKLYLQRVLWWTCCLSSLIKTDGGEKFPRVPRLLPVKLSTIIGPSWECSRPVEIMAYQLVGSTCFLSCNSLKHDTSIDVILKSIPTVRHTSKKPIRTAMEHAWSLVHNLDNDQTTLSDFKTQLEKGTDESKIQTMQRILTVMINGDPMPGLL